MTRASKTRSQGITINDIDPVPPEDIPASTPVRLKPLEYL